MSTVLVIGNGESRSNVCIKNFSKDYISVGCNAIHRETVTDHLVCCDKRMVEEAVISENTHNTAIHVRPDWFRYFRKIRKDKRIVQVPELPYQGDTKKDDPIHWGSGPYAVLLGANLGSTIMLLGFDLYSVSGKFNNLYKDTPNYKSADSSAIDPCLWIYQISKVFKHFPNKDFIVWNTRNWQMPKEWKHPNVKIEIL